MATPYTPSTEDACSSGGPHSKNSSPQASRCCPNCDRYLVLVTEHEATIYALQRQLQLAHEAIKQLNKSLAEASALSGQLSEIPDNLKRGTR